MVCLILTSFILMKQVRDFNKVFHNFGIEYFCIMITLKQAQEIVATEFARLTFNEQPSELYEPIHYVLSLGGKRLRPALVLLAHSLYSDDLSQVIKPAIGLEIFHNFTLLHDDIMDNAMVRRGSPTVHVKWDNNVGILSGDAMSIKAYQYICSCDPVLLPSVLQVFNQTALEVCEGQQYDMNFEIRDNVSEEEYLMMIKLKTSVLLAGSLKIGAILGHAPAEDADILYQIGLNLGLAFQLQDDLLDSFGDEAVFGKEIGKDIISNKKTYLLIKAFEKADSSLRFELEKWINADSFERSEKIKAVKNIFKKLDIENITQTKINSYFDLANNYLAKLNIPEAQKQGLHEFALKLKGRKK